MARRPDPHPELTSRWKYLIREELSNRHGLSRDRIAQLLDLKTPTLNTRLNTEHSFRATEMDVMVVEELVRFYDQVEVLHSSTMDKLRLYLESIGAE